MIKELSNGYYIDAWWDRFSKNYIVQVKDNEGYEIACEYCGNKGDRDSIIQYLTDEYMKGNLVEDISDLLEIGTHVQVNPDVKSKISGEFGVIKGIDDNKYMIEFDVMPGSTVSFSRHELIVMDDEELLEEKLFSKKKKKLPALDTLHPLEIIPDAAAGIDSFNNNNNVNNSESGSGEAMGEALRVNNANDKIYIAPKGKTLSWYKNEIKKYKPGYNFNRLNKVEASRKPYVAYMILDRILKQEELDDAQIAMANSHKNTANNYSDDNDINYDGDSFVKNGIEFESEEAAREYFGEGKIMPNKKSEKYYWNIMHEAYDIVEENIPKRKLNESSAKQRGASLKECLKNRDREDFDKLSECYELEMLYEAVEKDLSKEDIEAIKNYANDKRNSSEEVAAYIKGKLDEETKGGSFKARLNNVKMMHEVIKSMNNENAYGSWIYTMPDCPDESDFEWFAEDKDEYKDLIDTFNRIYNRYKKDGLYKPSEEILDFLNYSGYGDVEVLESLSESPEGRFEADRDESDLNETLHAEGNDFVQDIIDEAGFDEEEAEEFIHDLNNLRADEWVEVLQHRNCSEDTLEKFIREFNIDESLNEAMNYVSLADLIDWVSEHGQVACDIERYYNKYLDDMNTDEILDWIYDHEQLAKDYENHFGLMSEALNEEVELTKESIINITNNAIDEAGFELDKNIKHDNPIQSSFGNSIHWQVVNLDYEFDTFKKPSNSDHAKIEQIAQPLVKALDRIEEEFNGKVYYTWSFGVNMEGHVTAGIDVRAPKSIFEEKPEEDSLSLGEDLEDSIVPGYSVVGDIEVEPTEAEVASAVSDILIDSIGTTYENIKDFNSIKINLSDEGYDDMIPVIDSIIDDENNHIGKLQQLVNLATGSDSDIDAGKADAIEIIDSDEETL